MRRKHAKKSKIVLQCALVAVFALVAATEGMSQDAGPWSVIYEGFGYEGIGTGDGDTPASTNDEGDNVDDIPVDGGLSLLLAAGAAFGASRLRARK